MTDAEFMASMASIKAGHGMSSSGAARPRRRSADPSRLWTAPNPADNGFQMKRLGVLLGLLLTPPSTQAMAGPASGYIQSEAPLAGAETATGAQSGNAVNKPISQIGNYAPSKMAAAQVATALTYTPAQPDVNSNITALAGPALAKPASRNPQIATYALSNITAPPDTIEGYYDITAASRNATITLAGASFTAADVGKLFTAEGIGPNEGWLSTSITAVKSATSITLASAPTQSASGQSLRVMYGTDQSANLQNTFTRGQTLGIGSRVLSGIYLVSQPLSCLQAANGNNNSFSQPSSLCEGDPGAVIVARAPMTSLLTYGGLNGDYSQYLQRVTISGLTLDCHFEANYCADFPFFNDIRRFGQVTKNALLAGVRYGNLSAPASSAGSIDQNTGNSRDVSYNTVTSVTLANPPVVTTAKPHGYATGRTVTFVNSNVAQLMATPFQIKVTGPNTFTLNNTNSGGWTAFTSGQVALNAPGTPFPFFISNITNASPGVVTTSTNHGFTNGESVCLYDIGGTLVDGAYTTANVTATTFRLSGVNTRSLGTFTGGGIVLPCVAPTVVSKAVYYEHASDAEIFGSTFQGAVIAVYSTAGGYDGKFQYHSYNYPEQGLMYASFMGVGDNSLLGVQVDCPALFAFDFSGPRNSGAGNEVDCAGFTSLQNNLMSVFRLESAATYTDHGSRAKGSSTQAVLQTVSALGSLGAYGTVAGYSQWGFDAQYLTYSQPDGNNTGHLFINSPTGGANLTLAGVASSILAVYDTTSGHVGGYLTPQNGYVAFNTTDNTGAYTSNPWRASASNFQLLVPLQLPQTTWTDIQTCTAGQMMADANYIYVCTSANVVKRAALSAF